MINDNSMPSVDPATSSAALNKSINNYSSFVAKSRMSVSKGSALFTDLELKEWKRAKPDEPMLILKRTSDDL